MGNSEHLSILKQGVTVWNAWRKENPQIQPDLSEANLERLDLPGANLMNANLTKANLTSANLSQANLRGANLREGNLMLTSLAEADLHGANLGGADLYATDFSGADLSEVNLMLCRLIDTNFTRANLALSLVYGISAWRLTLDGAIQSNLIITSPEEPTLTVDDLEVAQFIHLLVNNQKIRDVIENISIKAVLILGRFTEERKKVLDALRVELRLRNYLPIIFDFDKPPSRDLTETISTLAHLSRFIIADITDAKSIPQELQVIVPDLPSVPIQPLLLSSQREYGMFEHFTRYPWVLPIFHYDQVNDLLTALAEKIITPAEVKAKELQKR